MQAPTSEQFFMALYRFFLQLVAGRASVSVAYNILPHIPPKKKMFLKKLILPR